MAFTGKGPCVAAAASTSSNSTSASTSAPAASCTAALQAKAGNAAALQLEKQAAKVVAQARDILRKRTGRVTHPPPHLPAANLAPSVRGEGGAEGARDEAVLLGSFEAAAASVCAVEKLAEVERERGGERGEGAGVSGKEGGVPGTTLTDAGFEEGRLRVVDLVTADATKLQRFQLLCHACRVG